MSLFVKFDGNKKTFVQQWCKIEKEVFEFVSQLGKVTQINCKIVASKKAYGETFGRKKLIRLYLTKDLNLGMRILIHEILHLVLFLKLKKLKNKTLEEAIVSALENYIVVKLKIGKRCYFKRGERKLQDAVFKVVKKCIENGKINEIFEEVQKID